MNKPSGGGAVVCALVSMLLWSGCPSLPTPDAGPTDDAGSDAGLMPDAGTNRELCQARAQLVCHAQATCSESAALFTTSFASEQDCVTGLSARCQRFLPSPTLPGHEDLNLYDDSTTCLQALSRLEACDVVHRVVFGSNETPVAGCFPSPGRLQNQEPCLDARQCASGYCRFLDNCGRCAERVSIGASCVTSGDCGFGVTCANGVCREYALANEACSQVKPCVPGFACQQNTCKALLDAGAPCDPRAPPACNFGYCRTTDNTCASIEVDRQPGEVCGLDGTTGALIGCGRGAVCRLFSASNQGLCVARARPGERCFFETGVQGTQCEIFSSCVNGVCTDPAQGPVCSTDGGTVTPPRGDGGYQGFDAGADVRTELQAQFTLACDALFACDRLQGIRAALVGDRAGCESILGPAIDFDLGTPGTGRSAAQLAACRTALTALDGCARIDVILDGLPGPAECQVPGTFGPGEVCASGQQCNAQSRCITDSLGRGCGICTALMPLGSFCIGDLDCAEGLSCANQRCVSAADAGASCSAGAPCDRALVCIAGRCVAPGGVGASCSTSNGAGCAGGAFCNAQGKCELLRVVGQIVLPDGGLTDGGLPGDGGIVGQTCGIIGGSILLCPYGTACKITNTTTRQGVCDPAGLPGETCSWELGLDGRGQCRFPSACIGGVCQVGDQSYCQ